MDDDRIEKIAKILSELKEPPFRLRQIKHAIYNEGILNYEQMLCLSLPLRKKLKDELGDILSLKFLTQTEGNQAKKTLFETIDGAKIESVKMTFNPNTNEKHESICISSQSGCHLGCRFCSTGTMGLQKNLTADEITDQVLFFKNRDNFKGSVSFMGMGEPFMNANAVFKALKALTDKEAFNYSDRKINISTVGVIPGIERLTTQYPSVNLAFSLHTPFNEQRSELMPINKIYSLSNVMKALDRHIEKTRRRVFLAYLLLKNINDSINHAEALVKLIRARGKIAYLYFVNLINFHPGNNHIPFNRTSTKTLKDFTNLLTSRGINYSIRQSFGVAIGAACGQLCVERNRPLSSPKFW